MGRDRAEPGRKGIVIDGDREYLPLPLRFLRSRACAELSPHALKLLMDLMAMLKPAAGGNGDLWPSADALTARGWVSDASRAAAMRELRAAGLVVITRRRSGRRCELVAITLWPLSCDQKKLDHLRVRHEVTSYRGADDQRFAPPTAAAPAQWAKARPRKTIGGSRSGREKLASIPLRKVVG